MHQVAFPGQGELGPGWTHSSGSGPLPGPAAASWELKGRRLGQAWKPQGASPKVAGSIKVPCNWVAMTILAVSKVQAVSGSSSGGHLCQRSAGVKWWKWPDAAGWDTGRAWWGGALLSGVLPAALPSTSELLGRFSLWFALSSFWSGGQPVTAGCGSRPLSGLPQAPCKASVRPRHPLGSPACPPNSHRAALLCGARFQAVRLEDQDAQPETVTSQSSLLQEKLTPTGQRSLPGPAPGPRHPCEPTSSRLVLLMSKGAGTGTTALASSLLP